MKVAVIVPPPLNTRVQGVVVPRQVLLLVPAIPLQPSNVELPVAVASRVMTAPLSEVVMLGRQVAFTVCVVAAVPVPPQLTGALTVPALGVILIVPVPVPAKVNTQFLASVNVVCAVNPEFNPLAPTKNFMFKS